MKPMTFEKLKSFYVDHLFDTLISFWMRFGIDRENGGFFTCFNNAGDVLKSKHKYIWSQGRFLWMLSRVVYAFQGYTSDKNLAEIREAAAEGARFLKEHARLPNGNCAWVLDETGRPILANRDGSVRKAAPGDSYDLGIAADEFLIYGMGEFSRAVGDRRYFEFALDLFESVRQRLSSGNFRSFPHDTPKGYKSHGKSMIMLETAQELADVARFFKDPAADRLERVALDSMRETLSVFVHKDKEILLEAVKEDNSPACDEMLGSYFNPGHSLEDAWFMMHFAAKVKDREALQTATEIVRWMTSKGWDREHGGLPQFLHIDGGSPRGEIAEQNKGDHMIVELTENWSNKLWWVHSEALYALILAYEHSRDPWFMDTYWKFHDYVFKTFPNPDKDVGEWIQIRDRQGRPEDKVVALPVKDPYHITRAFMHLIKSLERIGAGAG
ncbi:MAG: AGE family epimerase/isomerase [Spirochaetales bacterium]|nr:AGE family epimerase/isomerase [Spirochaetales bacterium]